MEIQQVWEYWPTAPVLFSTTISDADWLPNMDNVLVTFGNLPTTDPASNRAVIQEVTHTTPPELLFEVGITDNRKVYRAERLSSLYP